MQNGTMLNGTMQNDSTMQTAFIGMGANLPSAAGPPETTLSLAVRKLDDLGRVVRRSSLYSTKPVGYADQPRFFNAVLALETSISPRTLLEHLLRIERSFGRDRSSGIQNGPRTLDLDLLLYGDRVLSQTGLILPHPRLAERAFVLVPLAEIASNLLIAPQQLSVAQLLQTLQSHSPAETDAIFAVESDLWRAAPGGADPARADDTHPHD